jgi:hypothetical protein
LQWMAASRFITGFRSGRSVRSERQTLVSGSKAGRAVKRASKRKRRSKAIPALGAAGLSLTLASEASLASTAPTLDAMTRNAGVSHEITIREEEVFDVSLAAFHVFDKEWAKPFRAGERPVTVGQGCCLFACLAGQAASENNTYSPSVAYSPRAPRAIRPAHGPVRTIKPLPRPCDTTRQQRSSRRRVIAKLRKQLDAIGRKDTGPDPAKSDVGRLNCMIPSSIAP